MDRVYWVIIEAALVLLCIVLEGLRVLGKVLKWPWKKVIKVIIIIVREVLEELDGRHVKGVK